MYENSVVNSEMNTKVNWCPLLLHGYIDFSTLISKMGSSIELSFIWISAVVVPQVLFDQNSARIEWTFDLRVTVRTFPILFWSCFWICATELWPPGGCVIPYGLLNHIQRNWDKRWDPQNDRNSYVHHNKCPKYNIEFTITVNYGRWHGKYFAVPHLFITKLRILLSQINNLGISIKHYVVHQLLVGANFNI